MMTLFFGFLVLAVLVFVALIYFFKKITGENTEENLQRIGAVYEDLLKKQKDLTEKIEAGEKEFQAKKEEAATISEKLAAQALDEVRKKEEEVLKKARAEAEDLLAKAHGSRDQFAREMEIAASKKMVDFTADLLKHVYDDKIRELIHGQFVKNFMEQAKESDLASVDLRGQHPTIRTAIALKKEVKDQLCQVLAERLGSRDIQIDEAVDETLIAGVAMQIGTLALDGSFANALKEAAIQVKEKLQTT